MRQNALHHHHKHLRLIIFLVLTFILLLLATHVVYMFCGRASSFFSANMIQFDQHLSFEHAKRDIWDFKNGLIKVWETCLWVDAVIVSV